MIVATSATVRNLTSLRGVSLAIIALFRAKPSTPDRIQRTSHVRIQGKSRTEKSNPPNSLIVVTLPTGACGSTPHHDSDRLCLREKNGERSTSQVANEPVMSKHGTARSHDRP